MEEDGETFIDLNGKAWLKYFDVSSGCYYLYDELNNETRWLEYEDVGEYQNNAPMEYTKWEIYYDGELPYYYNKETGESVWEIPIDDPEYYYYMQPASNAFNLELSNNQIPEKKLSGLPNRTLSQTSINQKTLSQKHSISNLHIMKEASNKDMSKVKSALMHKVSQYRLDVVDFEHFKNYSKVVRKQIDYISVPRTTWIEWEVSTSSIKTNSDPKQHVQEELLQKHHNLFYSKLGQKGGQWEKPDIFIKIDNVPVLAEHLNTTDKTTKQVSNQHDGRKENSPTHHHEGSDELSSQDGLESLHSDNIDEILGTLPFKKNRKAPSRSNQKQRTEPTEKHISPVLSQSTSQQKLAINNLLDSILGPPGAIKSSSSSTPKPIIPTSKGTQRESDVNAIKNLPIATTTTPTSKDIVLSGVPNTVVSVKEADLVSIESKPAVGKSKEPDQRTYYTAEHLIISAGEKGSDKDSGYRPELTVPTESEVKDLSNKKALISNSLAIEIPKQIQEENLKSVESVKVKREIIPSMNLADIPSNQSICPAVGIKATLYSTSIPKDDHRAVESHHREKDKQNIIPISEANNNNTTFINPMPVVQSVPMQVENELKLVKPTNIMMEKNLQQAAAIDHDISHKPSLKGFESNMSLLRPPPPTRPPSSHSLSRQASQNLLLSRESMLVLSRKSSNIVRNENQGAPPPPSSDPPESATLLRRLSTRRVMDMNTIPETILVNEDEKFSQPAVNEVEVIPKKIKPKISKAQQILQEALDIKYGSSEDSGVAATDKSMPPLMPSPKKKQSVSPSRAFPKQRRVQIEDNPPRSKSPKSRSPSKSNPNSNHAFFPAIEKRNTSPIDSSSPPSPIEALQDILIHFDQTAQENNIISDNLFLNNQVVAEEDWEHKILREMGQYTEKRRIALEDAHHIHAESIYSLLKATQEQMLHLNHNSNMTRPVMNNNYLLSNSSSGFANSSSRKNISKSNSLKNTKPPSTLQYTTFERDEIALNIQKNERRTQIAESRAIMERVCNVLELIDDSPISPSCSSQSSHLYSTGCNKLIAAQHNYQIIQTSLLHRRQLNMPRSFHHHRAAYHHLPLHLLAHHSVYISKSPLRSSYFTKITQHQEYASFHNNLIPHSIYEHSNANPTSSSSGNKLHYCNVEGTGQSIYLQSGAPLHWRIKFNEDRLIPMDWALFPHYSVANQNKFLQNEGYKLFAQPVMTTVDKNNSGSKPLEVLTSKFTSELVDWNGLHSFVLLDPNRNIYRSTHHTSRISKTAKPSSSHTLTMTKTTNREENNSTSWQWMTGETNVDSNPFQIDIIDENTVTKNLFDHSRYKREEEESLPHAGGKVKQQNKEEIMLHNYVKSNYKAYQYLSKLEMAMGGKKMKSKSSKTLPQYQLKTTNDAKAESKPPQSKKDPVHQYLIHGSLKAISTIVSDSEDESKASQLEALHKKRLQLLKSLEMSQKTEWNDSITGAMKGSTLIPENPFDVTPKASTGSNKDAKSDDQNRHQLIAEMIGNYLNMHEKQMNPSLSITYASILRDVIMQNANNPVRLLHLMIFFITHGLGKEAVGVLKCTVDLIYLINSEELERSIKSKSIAEYEKQVAHILCAKMSQKYYNHYLPFEMMLKLVESFPDSNFILSHVVIYLRRMKYYDEICEGLLINSLIIDPNHDMTLRTYGHMLIDQGNFIAAIRYLSRITVNSVFYRSALLEIGWLKEFLHRIQHHSIVSKGNKSIELSNIKAELELYKIIYHSCGTSSLVGDQSSAASFYCLGFNSHWLNLNYFSIGASDYSSIGGLVPLEMMEPSTNPPPSNQDDNLLTHDKLNLYLNPLKYYKKSISIDSSNSQPILLSALYLSTLLSRDEFINIQSSHQKIQHIVDGLFRSGIFLLPVNKYLTRSWMVRLAYADFLCGTMHDIELAEDFYLQSVQESLLGGYVMNLNDIWPIVALIQFYQYVRCDLLSARHWLHRWRSTRQYATLTEQPIESLIEQSDELCVHYVVAAYLSLDIYKYGLDFTTDTTTSMLDNKSERQQYLDECLDSCDKCLTFNPFYIPALRCMASATSAKVNVIKASNTFDASDDKKVSHDLPATTSHGVLKRYLQTAHKADAIELNRKINQEEVIPMPIHSNPYLLRSYALIRWNDGRCKATFSDLLESVEVLPDSLSYRTLGIMSCLWSGGEAAVTSYNQRVRSSPMGSLHELALMFFTRSVGLSHDEDLFSLRCIAQLYYDQRLFKSARKYYRKALAIVPFDGLSLAGLALTIHELNKLDVPMSKKSGDEKGKGKRKKGSKKKKIVQFHFNNMKIIQSGHVEAKENDKYWNQLMESFTMNQAVEYLYDINQNNSDPDKLIHAASYFEWPSIMTIDKTSLSWYPTPSSEMQCEVCYLRGLFQLKKAATFQDSVLSLSYQDVKDMMDHEKESIEYPNEATRNQIVRELLMDALYYFEKSIAFIPTSMLLIQSSGSLAKLMMGWIHEVTGDYHKAETLYMMAIDEAYPNDVNSDGMHYLDVSCMRWSRLVAIVDCMLQSISSPIQSVNTSSLVGYSEVFRMVPMMIETNDVTMRRGLTSQLNRILMHKRMKDICQLKQSILMNNSKMKSFVYRSSDGKESINMMLYVDNDWKHDLWEAFDVSDDWSNLLIQTQHPEKFLFDPIVMKQFESTRQKK